MCLAPWVDMGVIRKGVEMECPTAKMALQCQKTYFVEIHLACDGDRDRLAMVVISA